MSLLLEPFFQNALIASILISIICGFIGPFITVNKLGFITGAISHAAYGGIGIAIFFALPILPITLAFAMICATIMGVLYVIVPSRADSFIGATWAIGMSIGVILLAKVPGYHVDLMAFLFGSIFMTSSTDLSFLGLAALIIPLFIVLFYRPLLLVSADPLFARLRNQKPQMILIFLMILMAIAAVVSVRGVGLLLVMILMTLPPVIMELFFRSIKGIIAASILFSLFTTLGGIYIAWHGDIPAGPAIATLTGLLSLLLPTLKWLQPKLWSYFR